MAEISLSSATTESTAQIPQQHVQKGAEHLGWVLFGGSSFEKLHVVWSMKFNSSWEIVQWQIYNENFW